MGSAQNCVWLGINPNMRWDDQVCSFKLDYAVCHRNRVTDRIHITSTVVKHKYLSFIISEPFLGTLNAPKNARLGKKIDVSFTGTTNHLFQVGLERCTALFTSSSVPLTFTNSDCYVSPTTVR